MAKIKTFADCEDTLAVEALAAEMEAPLHAELGEIDEKLNQLMARKREIHKEIDATERQSAERRNELKPADAVDQYLVRGDLSARDLEIARAIVAQADARRN